MAELDWAVGFGTSTSPVDWSKQKISVVDGGGRAVKIAKNGLTVDRSLMTVVACM